MQNFSLILILQFVVSLSFGQNPADTTLAYRYYKVANSHYERSNYDSALRYFQMALPLYEKVSVTPSVVRCYNRIAETHHRLANYEAVVKYASHALDISNAKLAGTSVERGVALSILGRIHKDMGDYSQAMAFHEQALEVLRTALTESHPEVAKVYGDVGVIYFYRQDYAKSMEYYERALAILKKAYGENHKSVGLVYYRMGMRYFYTYEHDVAEGYFNKAIAVYKRVLGEVAFELASPYTMIGEGYRYRPQPDFRKALFYYKKAEPHLGSRKSVERILLYRNRAFAYTGLSDYQSALENYEKAAAMGKEVLGDKHPAMATLYYALGTIHENQGDLDLALANVQKSIIANFISFYDSSIYALPPYKDYKDRNEAFTSLIKKAELLRKKYITNKIIDDLNASLNTYLLLDTILLEERRSTLNDEDKIELGRRAMEIYEGGIGVCIELQAATGNTEYHERAFLFSERNKASVLMEALSDISAKGIGLVPVSMVDLESQLKAYRIAVESKIRHANLQKDTVKLSGFRSELFNVNRRLDSLVVKMEKDYPAYYKYKYQNDVLNIRSAQAKLHDGTLLLEFMEGYNNIYIFALTARQYKILSFARDSTYVAFLDQFREIASNNNVLAMNRHESYDKFTTSASVLYELLLKRPIDAVTEKESITSLLIIPDGLLSTIPFDILLTKPPIDNSMINYRALSYLIKDYAVMYGYSATLYFMNDGNSESHKVSDFIAFAPSYEENVDDASIPGYGKFRDAVTALKWTSHEVEALSLIIDTDYFLNSNATEKRFKKDAGQYSVIHLAMHAVADNEDPMNSSLIFANDNDSTEDGLLHAFELYNMRLNAQMAVLSACNTGYGKLVRGEGVMSLARAFSYAGVPCVVMTHWGVDDQATSKLMANFYKNLKDGMTKGEALRQARLSYLAEASSDQTHPFYWGAFITVGNDSPLSLNTVYWNYAFSAVAVMLVFGAICRYRRRKSS